MEALETHFASKFDNASILTEVMSCVKKPLTFDVAEEFAVTANS